MACIMSIAMLLTVLVYVPKTASAADKQPVVTVLGASLRLDASDNNGKQSMRVAIKVDNADSAKACSIRLSINGKNYVVSTKNTGSEVAGYTVNRTINGVYSKDPDKNSVVYAVVVTGIPEASFYDSIRITGYADTMKETSSEVKSSTEARNVMGVVNALQAQYPKVGITIENGTLKKSGGENLTAKDLEGYNDNPVDYTVETPDLSNIEKLPGDGNVTRTPQGITYNETGTADPLFIPIEEAVVGETIVVNIKGHTGAKSGGFRCYPSDVSDRAMADQPDWIVFEDKDVDFDITKEIVIYDHKLYHPQEGEDPKPCNVAKTICIKGTSWGVPVTDLTISSITVTHKGKGNNPAPLGPGIVDLSTFNNDNNSKASYDSNTCQVTIEDDTGKMYSFKLPESESFVAGDQVTITLTGNYTGTKQFRAWISKDVWSNVSNSTPAVVINQENFTSSVTVTLTDAGNFVNIKALNGNFDGKLTIYKIKVEKVIN